MKLLFICSRNINRSRTAERIFQIYEEYDIKSAGTDETARVTVTTGHVRWADLIFVMERKHQRILSERFPQSLSGKPVVVLNIPDSYYYMDDELIQLLFERVSRYIDL